MLGTCKTKEELLPRCKELWIQAMVDDGKPHHPAECDPEWTPPKWYSKDNEDGYFSDRSELAHLLDWDDLMEYAEDGLVAQGSLLVPKMTKTQIEKYLKDVKWELHEQGNGTFRGYAMGTHVSVTAHKITIDI